MYAFVLCVYAMVFDVPRGIVSVMLEWFENTKHTCSSTL